MKPNSRPQNSKELVSFPRESTYFIGNVTYQVKLNFCEEGKSLPEIVKRTLLGNIRNNTLRTFEKPPPKAV